MSFREYIGIPFEYGGRSKKGTDCWGIIVLMFREKLGVEIFDMTNYEPSTESSSKFYASISEFHKQWRKIETSDLQKYDIILFALDEDKKDIPTHIALYTDFNKIIHCTEFMPVSITRLDRWQRYAHSAYRYIGDKD